MQERERIWVWKGFGNGFCKEKLYDRVVLIERGIVKQGSKAELKLVV